MKYAKTVLLAALLAITALPVAADERPTFELTIKDHKFDPAEITVPAGQAFIVKVKNLDLTAEEIDSSEMKIEKVFAGSSDGILHVHALEAGRHDFMGEYHEDTAKGAFIAK